MKFLNKVLDYILSQTTDLSQYTFVIPGKRPIVFIKQILASKYYEGFLPDFITIEDCITDISEKTPIQGVGLWLLGFEVYQQTIGDEDFDSFVKWFPTLAKDWDDMMKFSENDEAVLRYMLDEERIKNWGEDLGDDTARKRNLDFWRKMNQFLPVFKQTLMEKNLATSGMIHQFSKQNIADYVEKTTKKFVFIGFNALTPVEEKLVRGLLQWDKALCYFQADSYYMNDTRQEAGAFLRKHIQWKEFNDYRAFKWIEDDFEKPKNIQVFEVSGNITQTKVLPEVFSKISTDKLENTALVLLDENLLPATLDAVNSVSEMNITMGFPLKNLHFSNLIKQLFHIQKQLVKNPKTYYHSDIVAFLEGIPQNSEDRKLVNQFLFEIKDRNMVYISAKKMDEMLSDWSHYSLLKKAESATTFLENLISFCFTLKFEVNDSIVFENISHFEQSFQLIKNLISEFKTEIKIETLEVLVNQMINLETLDFQGEPLEGLQIMGLLETRLLNFKNIILLSVNEGKLPLGNTQNTYLPFDVRKKFDMHTFLENDSIYAYHFYRLLQDTENAFLLYNGLSSGVNTGEKSRFITQLELESQHHIEEIVIENQSEPIAETRMTIEKTPKVQEKLAEWKTHISATHLTSYLYDPIQFYLNYILKTKETSEIEEELSNRNYGNLVHYSLEELYGELVGVKLTTQDLENLINRVDAALDAAIIRLKHQPEFYSRGMNYVHKNIAKKVLEKIVQHDLNEIKSGKSLEIIAVEKRIENVSLFLDEANENEVLFFGYIDRIDRLDGTIRLIDYKTAKAKELKLTFKDDNIDTLLMQDKFKQAIQLCIYMHYLEQSNEFSGNPFEAGIWSFADASKGPQILEYINGNHDTAMISIKNLILEILNPEVPFIESEKVTYQFQG